MGSSRESVQRRRRRALGHRAADCCVFLARAPFTMASTRLDQVISAEDEFFAFGLTYSRAIHHEVYTTSSEPKREVPIAIAQEVTLTCGTTASRTPQNSRLCRRTRAPCRIHARRARQDRASSPRRTSSPARGGPKKERVEGLCLLLSRGSGVPASSVEHTEHPKNEQKLSLNHRKETLNHP